MTACAPGQPSHPSVGAAANDKIGEAAAQFEALFLAQMLRNTHASGGWLNDGDDQASQTMMEIAEEQIAQALAANGGLGLGRTIADSLRKQAPSAPVTNP